MIYVLDKYDRTVGVLSNEAPSACPYFDDEHIENISSGVNSYQFTIPSDHENSAMLEVNGSVIIKDLDSNLQMFVIKEIEDNATKDGNTKTVYCEHIAIAELLYKVVRPATLTSYTVEQAVKYVLAETDWSLGETVGDVSKTIKFEQHITVLEALKQIASEFEAEIKFEVVYQYGKVKKKLIHAASEIGEKTYKVFSYSKDLTEVTRKEDSSEVVTALIAVGKGDQEGTSLSLKGFTGNNVKYPSALENDFVESTEAFQRYNKRGSHLFGIYTDENATNQYELYQNTVKKLKELSKPSITYECKVLLLERLEGWENEKVRVGDRVRIYDKTFTPELLLEARVLELKRSYTNPENDEIILGDYKEIKLSDASTLKKLQATILQNENQWLASSYIVNVTSSNGLIFKGGLQATKLEATVLSGTSDVTSKIDKSYFKWTRKSTDTNADIIWNKNNGNGTKSITVTRNDIIGSTTFECNVTV